MKLGKRIQLLERLGGWLRKNDEHWQAVKEEAYQHNKWFTGEFTEHRMNVILSNFLDKEKLTGWIDHYHIDDNILPKKVGVVMAGNIPLVGFHDFLCCFVAGHHAVLKLSDRDSILMQQLLDKMVEFDPETKEYVATSEMLRGCDAYIATGSNNSSRYFEYYFGKYPSVIRKNKTSVAILDGTESAGQMELLADDVFLYFGLGCRSVTQLYLPRGFDFVPLLDSFRKYDHLKNHARFKDNYDYNLALLIMNKVPYLTNDSVLLVEGDHLFSPVSELYYAYYDDREKLIRSLRDNNSVQCIAGGGQIHFGQTQQTGLYDYADGIDTMEFLLGL